MTRPAQVVINLSALRNNFSKVKSVAPSAKIIAVVKADAYGHGLTRIAGALSQADGFGVACLQEAEELRNAGITQPVVLLEGPFSSAEITPIDHLGLEIVVHHLSQIEILEKSRVYNPVTVWLKVDSGMHRLGFSPEDVGAVWERLKQCTAVNPNIRLMTHLADATDRTHEMTEAQLKIFNNTCDGLQGDKSIANSAGILAWPNSHAEIVRPGLMLYGVSPMEDDVAADYDLQPVMTLRSKLISIKRIKKGETVGYGADWVCPEDMSVGIVAAGYGDGYPRHASTGTPVLVKNIRSQIIGKVSMDMLAVDLRDVADVAVGDSVVLWGDGLPVEEIAKHAGTIPYELLCAVHKRLDVTINE